MIKYIDSLAKDQLHDKTLLLRVDFNVPVKDNLIQEDFRIRAVKQTLDYLMVAGARVALVSHISDVASFEPLIEQLAALLGRPIFFVKDMAGESLASLAGVHGLVLLDNIRAFEGEELNDPIFADSLARGFDLYVNDAFAVSHRAHASVSAITQYLPSYGGLLMKKELENLTRVMETPAQGKVLILGGAKISTKLPVIKNFINKAEYILIGGALANNFLKARGLSVGQSLVDDDFLSVKDLDTTKIRLPKDVIVRSSNQQIRVLSDLATIASDDKIFDIGPATIQEYSDIIHKSSMVVWNGPMGRAEDDQFRAGTRGVAEAVSQAVSSTIGGGDTIAAVADMLDKFNYVSTGGGAMLELLAGNSLPGLVALHYY